MDAGKPYGQTVGAFLQKYEGSYPILMHKWRKSVLLVSNTDWYFDEETSVPYAKTLKLRALCKKGRGFMSLADIADTVLSMSTLQVERAGAEFPVLASGEIFRPVFLLARTHTGFYSTQGAVLDAELSSELAKFPIVANCPLFKDNRAIAIRFVERTAPSEQLQGWEARIEVLDRGKVWRPVAGFPQKQHISAD